MKSVVVLLAPGFEEIEALTVVDVLRRADVRVVTAGLTEGLVTGSHDITVKPDTTLDKVRPEAFDMLVLPGGMPGTTNLRRDGRVKKLLADMAKTSKHICAICAAPVVLKDAGVAQGRAVTSHPVMREELKDLEYREDRVVTDDKIVTSRGPGTAMEFALELVRILVGQAKAAELATAMVVR